MKIRDAVPADVPGIAALERECFSLPWPENIIAAQLTGQGKIMLAAEIEGELAGYMGLQYVLDEGYIANVCTAPGFRRRGVASALIDDKPRPDSGALVPEPRGARLQCPRHKPLRRKGLCECRREAAILRKANRGRKHHEPCPRVTI